jgi:hypothetical protein
MKKAANTITNKYPFWAQVLMSPFGYILMILKIFVTIPIYIIGLCNRLTENVKINEKSS